VESARPSPRLPAALLLGAVAGCGSMGLEYSGDLLGPVLTLDPAGDLYFPDTSPEAESAVLTLTLGSAGDEAVSLVDVYVDENSSVAFWLRDDLPVPLRLEPGDSFQVDVHFSPYAVGQFSGTLVIDQDNQGTRALIERGLSGAGCVDDNLDGACD
jgi:hypothetical protein